MEYYHLMSSHHAGPAGRTIIDENRWRVAVGFRNPQSAIRIFRGDSGMIQAIDLTKRYEDGGILALDHLSLTVHPGEIYCLLGANGAGKTTTINLFFNFIEPTRGQAFINGYDCTKDPLEAKKYAAYVSENVMLYGNFTARQNLDFFAKLAGRQHLHKEDYAMVMRQVGLPERAFEQRLKTFSKGMRQKLGIAIAILKQAPALLLDEPTSGLDPKAGAECIELLLQLREEGKAILMSTHDIFRAKGVADRVGIMKEGHLIMERTKEDLEEEDLEQIYLKYMEVS
jgi:ABC-2 type transport system ATP-binding protein